MRETVTIGSLRDLDVAIATAVYCQEPPPSERRSIHESGAWSWRNSEFITCGFCRLLGYQCNDCHGNLRWVPMPFSSDPAASFRLREKMRELGWMRIMVSSFPSMEMVAQFLKLNDDYRPRNVTVMCLVSDDSTDKKMFIGQAQHRSEHVAWGLASVRAMGVQVELAEGWDI